MSLTLDLRARPVLVVVLCVVAAAALGLFILERNRGSSNESSSSANPPVATTPAAPHRSAVKPTTVHRASPAQPKAKPKPAVAPSNLLPARIRQAFSEDRVVVVALYNPKAKIDGTALAEAKDGTKDTDAAFVPIDVRKKSVDSLTARYGAIQDPSILVLRPSGELFVRIDGFADRDTVAQAAANAES